MVLFLGIRAKDKCERGIQQIGQFTVLLVHITESVGVEIGLTS